MNGLFALVIVTAAGPQIGPGLFNSYAECQTVVARLSNEGIPGYCMKSQPVDIEKEMSKMILMMKKFQKEMDNQ
jgi:hypothetical protein